MLALKIQDSKNHKRTISERPSRTLGSNVVGGWWCMSNMQIMNMAVNNIMECDMFEAHV